MGRRVGKKAAASSESDKSDSPAKKAKTVEVGSYFCF